MKLYELTYLISSELTEEQARSLQGKITALIQEKGGILIGENPPSLKKLAYSVKNQSSAYLATTNFQLSPEQLSDLEKNLKLENEILRYIILSKKEEKKTASKGKTRTIKKPRANKKVELKEIEKKLDEILSDNK